MRLKVSLAQINPKGGDLRGNTLLIQKGIIRAKEDACDVVVFPELCLTGYCLDEKLLISRHFLRENRRALMEGILPASQGIAVIVGFVDFDEQSVGPDGQVVRHNAAAVMQDGHLLQIVHKRLLPAYRYFDDKRYFAPGVEAQPVSLRTPSGDVSVGVLICEDLWEKGYPLKPCQIYAEKGAQCLFAINASPFVGSQAGERDGKRFERAALIQQQARRYGVPICYINTVGVGDNGKNIIPFDGMSVAYDSQGQLVLVLDQFVEDQGSICLEEGRARPVPELAFDREAEIFQALVMGVRDYYQKTGIFEGVLETVSGGIDSALGTAIAREAMGKELLSVYNLPSRYNTERTQRLARELADNFQLKYHVIPIQDMVDQVIADFERHLHPILSPVTVENLQARIRGLIMMAESNDRRALLLSNGNKTEIGLGYTTLYGDMVGGLSVIGDLSKPDVYRLAEYVNRHWEREMIPRGIFEVAPSAELSDNQIDPFDYQVVGPVVGHFMDKGFSPAEVEEQGTLPKGFSRPLLQELFGKLNRSVYKRLQGSPIIVVSRRAFGFDLRETIINGWSGS